MENIDQSDDMAVLIADDDIEFSERLGRALARRGFVPTVTQSCSDARRIASTEKPAFAVCDLRLQDGSGLDIVEALKKARPDARSIILTGYGDTPTVVAAIKLGAFDYLAKPASGDEIAHALLADPASSKGLPDTIVEPEQARLTHIARIFEEVDGNVSEAARRLGMHRRTLQRILQRARAKGHASF
ncbi:two-component system, response regulator RegA [Roseivivax halotolerans]|uniref:Two-component system, response regulator RegA n=2 Tax=Roseivivax halotolerans TaxID=93684 RepID=A0A1I5VHJ4_9RHOB|nr:two-component system, response regulator RegA [Roseivivax halotolerans]